jgi:hypothetical protein
MNSRAKGKRGELEAAHLLSEIFGEKFIRGKQYSGSEDSPDVMPANRASDLAMLHWEVKWTETFNLYKAMEQSKTDSGDHLIPLVLHKRNHAEPVVVVRASDLLKMVQLIHNRTVVKVP